jgi:hypothetical protein
MCRRTCDAAGWTVSFRTRPGVGRWAALALVAALAVLPARAQQPGPPNVLPPPRELSPATPAPVAPPAPPPAPAPGCACAASDEGFIAADTHWGWYVETGPVFPVGATLQTRLDTGFTVQGGLREYRNGTNGSVFAELAAEYWAFDTNHVTIDTGVDIFFPDSAFRPINSFFATTLTDFQQFGLHGAIGWTYYPEALSGFGGALGGDRGVFLTGRVGFRGGIMNGDFLEAPLPEAVQLFQRLQQLHGAAARVLDRVQSTNPYFGPFATLGVGLTWKDACLGGRHLGDVALTAEVELGYEATDLGAYLHEADLVEVSPRITLAITY